MLMLGTAVCWKEKSCIVNWAKLFCFFQVSPCYKKVSDVKLENDTDRRFSLQNGFGVSEARLHQYIFKATNCFETNIWSRNPTEKTEPELGISFCNKPKF